MAVKVNGTEVIDDSRNVTNVGTVDGRNVSSDGTKLDGVATGADVTSTALPAALTGLPTHADPASSDLLAIYDDSASTWKKATITAAALQGDKGQKGEVGVDGSNGAAGAKGQKGEVGLTGNTGNTGGTGLTGDTGSKGQKGEVGAAGSNGGTGSKGQKGEVGSQGIQGIQGNAGSNGATGAKGQKGEVGSQGIQGIQGVAGNTGGTGGTGSKGQKGQAGGTGSNGATGSKGQKGEVGQKGQTGNTGNTGGAGGTGAKGQKGQTGNTGGAGGTGSKGQKGEVGQKGQKGQTGNTGNTGGAGGTGSKGQKGQTGSSGGTGATGSKGQKGENAVTATSVTFGSGVTLQESTDRADLLQITSSTSTWGGLQIRNSSNEGRWSFMTDGATAGFYDDENNEWAVQMVENSSVSLYQNGATRLSTRGGGVGVTALVVGNLTSDPHNTGGLQVNNTNNEKIVLSGSSEPYIRFQNSTTDKSTIGLIADLLVFNNSANGTYEFRANGNLGTKLKLTASNQDNYGSVYGTHNNEIGFLNDGDDWAYRILDNTQHEWKLNNTQYMRLDTTSLSTRQFITVGGGTTQSTNNPYNSVSSTKLMFGSYDSNAQNAYYLGTNLNNFGGNYTKLDLRWYTGVRMGAETQYGGIRMYNSAALTTKLFSVGEGDSNVRVTNTINAKQFTDIDNTSYYVNPASTSVLNALTVTSISGNGSGLTGVGASTTYGAVGTYLMGYRLGAGITDGTTYAGSTLQPMGFLYGSSTAVGNDGFRGSTWYTKGGSALSGTWRAMGRSNINNGATYERWTLFVRIS
tara:strand:- start:22691 stop:25087 length:2397 start_codon:yes stop_codon:yes gene_type:complete